MATGPTFTPADAFSAPLGDALEEVLVAQREQRAAMAREVVAIAKAHAEQVRNVRSGNRMLANRSFRAQIAALLSITEKSAENLIGYALTLDAAFPRTLDALHRSEMSWQHATVIIDELGSVESGAREALEATALAQAGFVTPHKLGRALRLARELQNPETLTERHEAARHLRGLFFEDGADGMSTMFYTDTSVQVHAIFNRLNSAARGVNGPLEKRSLNARRADIFAHVMLAEIDGEAPGVVPDEADDERFVRWFRGIRVQVMVSVPALTLLGKSEQPAILDGFVPIDPVTARRLVAGAKSFIRILTDPDTGTTLSVGRRRYKVPRDLRTYLQIRDLTCRFPGCIQPAQLSDIDHTIDWQFGGETKASNLACLCPGHHTLKGETAWTVTQADNDSGVLTWTDPSGRQYRTFPQNPLPYNQLPYNPPPHNPLPGQSMAA
jgi:hypothetical protein